MSPEPALHPRRGHAPVGQVGPRLHRVRRRRRARRARRRRPGLAPDPARRRRRHDPQRLPGLRRRRDVRPEARLERRAGHLELRRVRQRIAGAAERPRADPRRLLRRRARHRRRHHAEGLLRPGRRRAQERPRLAALPPARRDQPGVLRAAGPPADGPLRRHARGLRPGEGQERQARPGEPERPVPQGDLGRGRAGQPGGGRPAAAARHLRHLRRRGGADRGEQGVRRRSTWARVEGVPSVRAVVHRDAAATRSICPNCPTSPPTPPRRWPRRSGRSRTRSSTPPTTRPASGPRTSAWPRSTTCPPRSSSTGTSTSACAPKGEAEQLLRSGATTIGGRIPVNPSGGLACFGEAIPAQAIAQVCELTWQLRGQATGRQVEGATVGVTANQGLFGHGSSVIVAR